LLNPLKNSWWKTPRKIPGVKSPKNFWCKLSSRKNSRWKTPQKIPGVKSPEKIPGVKPPETNSWVRHWSGGKYGIGCR
jgi:hypothetical protein